MTCCFPNWASVTSAKKKWGSCTNVPSGPFQFYGLFYKILVFFSPLSVILHINRNLHIVSRTKKFTIWRLGKLASLSFLFHVFILYHLSRQQTQKTLQSPILLLPSNIDKNGGSNDGKDQLELHWMFHWHHPAHKWCECEEEQTGLWNRSWIWVPLIAEVGLTSQVLRSQVRMINGLWIYFSIQKTAEIEGR